MRMRARVRGVGGSVRVSGSVRTIMVVRVRIRASVGKSECAGKSGS